jgi:hypothetical protein
MAASERYTYPLISSESYAKGNIVAGVLVSRLNEK